ncbi:lycopene cyclase domain-containing protein [Marinoscillum sp.]|uniref:lycopene cyclase domain-containing protein n=1 Tax=Marinoscillum sp. TaxID=2024838 RepID=UPI003BAA0B08
MKSLYLILHIFTISFPLVRSFEPRIQYAKKWSPLFQAIGITGFFFIVWDVLFTRAGVWGFNPDYLVGIYIFELPLEEILFFITVPFASVFIYECVHYFLPHIHTSSAIKWTSMALGLGLIGIALVNSDQAYTFWNFLFAGSFLLFVSLINPWWFGHFWVAYLLHLIPFILVNGVLTGYGLDAPIVWYNNDENLSIRILTIPIEDTMYALLLLLMNVFLFEKLKKSFKQNP